MSGTNPPVDFLILEPVRGMDGVREADVEISGIHLKLAVIHGTENARRFLEQWKHADVHYDFVEVMACRGGCIGGGGQPKTEIPMTDEIRNARIASLYERDAHMKLRLNHENPEINKLYSEFYKSPLSGLAERMLHTTYRDRSDDLGPEGKKNPDKQKSQELEKMVLYIEETENKKEKETGIMKKWKCSVCGYIHEGENPPKECPICKVPADRFQELKEEAPAKAPVPAGSAGKPAPGSKTEKNLMEAFAGESMARNKYTYWADVAKETDWNRWQPFSWRRRSRSVSMQRCGSVLSMGSTMWSRIWWMRLPARTKSGPRCTNGWQRKQKRRGTMRLRPNLSL